MVKFILKCSFILILWFVSLPLKAQEKQDTAIRIAAKDTLAEVHSPKKASRYSAILPGLGQAYNKKYWKIPFIYAGFGAIGYFINFNTKYYKQYRTAYIHFIDRDENTNDFLKLEAVKYYNLENPTDRSNFANGLQRQKEYYRRNRDLLVILTAGFWGLNIIDASVNAHFFDFDMSDDLSIRWQPSIVKTNSQLAYGFNCTIKF